MFFQVFGHKKRGLQKPRFLQTHFLMERKKMSDSAQPILKRRFHGVLSMTAVRQV